MLTDRNVDDSCNVVRKSSGKNANGTSVMGQLVSVIAQENLNLVAFLSHHRWQCTPDWEIKGVQEQTVCKLTGQKKLDDEHKDLSMLSEVNKADMAGSM